jgi:hypothetical protein
MISQFLILVSILVILLAVLILTRRRAAPALRGVAAFESLPDQMGKAAESGRALHISLGTGGVGGSDTVTSLAGLSALAYLAEQGVAANAPPLVTVSDPTLLPLAQHVLRRAYERRGRKGDFRWSQVRLISPMPVAYALGTMDILNREPVLANVMLGSFGPEVGLLTQAGSQAGLVQIGGTDAPQALSILYASTDQLIIGEELYAADAYLRPSKAKLFSLVAEDVVRLVLIAGVIVFAILRILGAS